MKKYENFVHLHNHTDFSIFDGFMSPRDMVKRASELNYKAIAITDHGHVGGFLKFQKACDEFNVKPIFGLETYVCNDLSNSKSKRHHLILLAKNDIGLKNIMKLSSVSYKHKAYGFPRINLDILKQYKEGLIVSTACLAGEFARKIEMNDIDGAFGMAKEYKEIWDDDFYLEVMYTGIPEQKKVIEYAEKCSEKLGIEIIATNDCHYSKKENAQYQQVKKAISMRKPLEYPDKPVYYIKSYEQMNAIFKNRAKKFLDNTVKVSDKCNARIKIGQSKLPEFKIPENKEFENFKNKLWRRTDEQAYLTYLARKGLNRLSLDKDEKYINRLEEELETIRFTGFDRYFLIVEEYVAFAMSPIDTMTGESKEKVKVGLGRGSCCGSLVLFCLSVTGIDPIKHDLSMDRFLYSEGEYHIGANEIFEDETEVKKWENFKTGNKTRKQTQEEKEKSNKIIKEISKIVKRKKISEIEKDRLIKELNFIKNKPTIINDIYNLINIKNEKGIGTQNKCNSFILYFVELTSKKANLDKEFGFLYQIDKDQSRASPPDIDIDFEERETLLKHLCDLYGKNNIALIGNIGTYGPKASIQLAAKAMDITKTNKIEDKRFSSENNKEGIRLSKMISNLPISLETWLGDDPNYKPPNKRIKDSIRMLREERDKNPEIFKAASMLEGKIRSFGTHAAGVVISSEDITDSIPLTNSSIKKNLKFNSGVEWEEGISTFDLMTTQFDMAEVEEMGLLKFDFLQISNLKRLSMAINLIKERYGKIDFDIDKLEMNDEKVFKLINEMKLEGLFQISGDAFIGKDYPLFDKKTGEKLLHKTGAKKGKQKVFHSKGVMEIIGCSDFNDIVVPNAIGRPGPLALNVPEKYAEGKKNPSMVSYLHPSLEPILKDTYSQIVYQEQITRIAIELADFSFFEADELRKSCAKPKKYAHLLSKIESKFREGCIKNDIPKHVVEELYNAFMEFSQYAFNKSHCLSEDTLLYEKNKKEFIKLKNIKKGMILDSFLNEKIIEDEVKEVIDTGVQDVYEIQLSNEQEVECTLEHKFLCIDDKYRTIDKIKKENIKILFSSLLDTKYKIKECKILSIKKIGKKQTYNIEMKSNQHNYAVYGNEQDSFLISKNSTAYGAICYQTAFLKTYYPEEFMCALLTDKANTSEEKLELTIKKLKKEYPELKILKPDINKSDKHYKPVGKLEIIAPFLSLKGIGKKVSDEIINKRVKTYVSIDHFLRSVNVSGTVVSDGIGKILIESESFRDLGSKEEIKIGFKRYYQMKKMVSRPKSISDPSIKKAIKGLF